jgi:hypothetical protein
MITSALAGEPKTKPIKPNLRAAIGGVGYQANLLTASPMSLAMGRCCGQRASASL